MTYHVTLFQQASQFTSKLKNHISEYEQEIFSTVVYYGFVSERKIEPFRLITALFKVYAAVQI